jgi:hypothetical protein
MLLAVDALYTEEAMSKHPGLLYINPSSRLIFQSSIPFNQNTGQPYALDFHCLLLRSIPPETIHTSTQSEVQLN